MNQKELWVKIDHNIIFLDRGLTLKEVKLAAQPGLLKGLKEKTKNHWLNPRKVQ